MNGFLIISLDSGLPLFTRLCSPMPNHSRSGVGNGNNGDVMQIASLLFALRKISLSLSKRSTLLTENGMAGMIMGEFEEFRRGSECILTMDQYIGSEHILTAILLDCRFWTETFGRLVLDSITKNMLDLLPLLKDSNQPRQMREKIDSILTNIVQQTVQNLIARYQQHDLSIILITTLNDIDLNGPKFQGRSGINFTPAKQDPSSPSLLRTPADTTALPVTTETLDRQSQQKDVPVKMSKGICGCFNKTPNKVQQEQQIKTSVVEVQPKQQFQTPARPNRNESGIKVEVPPSTGKRTDTRYEIDILVLFFDSFLNQRFKEDLYHASIAFSNSIGDFAFDLPVEKQWIGDSLAMTVDYNASARKFQPRCLTQYTTDKVSSNELEILSLEDGSPVKQHSLDTLEVRSEVTSKTMEVLIVHDMLCLLEWKVEDTRKLILHKELRDISLYILWCYSQKLAIPGFCYARDLF